MLVGKGYECEYFRTIYKFLPSSDPLLKELQRRQTELETGLQQTRERTATSKRLFHCQRNSHGCKSKRCGGKTGWPQMSNAVFWLFASQLSALSPKN
jgi:hypothetical protein